MRCTRAAAGYEKAGDIGARRSAQAHEVLALNASFLNEASGALIERLEREPLEGDALAMTLHARIWQALDRGPLEEIASLYARELDVVEEQPSIVNWYRASPTSRFVGLPGVCRACWSASSPARVAAPPDRSRR